jgi:uncharacterized protein (DUF488 family)
MARKSNRLFTIGYEQTPAKAVLDELESAGVKLLVDVRAVTSSRRPGFSKKQLAAGLDERGIAYVHLAALGTPKEGRLAARSGQYEALEKIYAKHLKTPQAREEIDELSALVRKAGPVCLLCYERNHEHCHRRFIAEIIAAKDAVKVENLDAPLIYQSSWQGLSRPSTSFLPSNRQDWMPGTRPGMTTESVVRSRRTTIVTSPPS